MLNILNLVAFLSASVFSLIYVFSDVKELYPAIISAMIFCLIFATSIYLNKKNMPSLARHLHCLSLVGVTTVSTFFQFGLATNVHFYYLLFSVSHLLVWRLKQLPQIVFYFTLNLLLYVFAQYFWSQEGDFLKFPAEQAKFTSVFTVFVSFGSILAALWINLTHVESNEKKLSSQAEELKDMIEELNAQQAEINRQSIELDDLNSELTNKNKALTDLNATKDKFFSIIAHDLKNPAGSLKGLAEELRYKYDSFSDDDKKHFIEWISASSTQLLELLENLLDWSRSQIQKVAFHPDRTNLKLLCDNVVALLALQAKNKNISLNADISEDIYLFSDVNLLSAIIRNLCSNAIKFTPEGGKIYINAEIINDYAYISIIDSGLGMSKDAIDGLFKIGGSASTLGTANEKGSGLGLILCKEYVERHGGEINVESEINRGSKFTFNIPLYKEKN